MRAGLLRQAVEEIKSMSMDANVKAVVIEAIYKVARRNGIPSFERDEQIAFAQQLLAQRVPRDLIAARLTACFEIGKTTAYERIARALQLSGKTTNFRTGEALNDGVGLHFEIPKPTDKESSNGSK